MPSANNVRTHLGRQLASEWEYLVRSHRHLDLPSTLRAAGYREQPGPETPLPGRNPADEPVDEPAHDAADVAADVAADARLADLVRRAAHEPLAARIVLQRLLPGLISMARRRGDGWGHVVHVYDELLANAWIVIRCYPIDRRPARVAANLLRDIEYQTFTRPARLRRHPTETIDPRRPGHEPVDRRHDDDGRHAFVELVEVLAAARDAGLDDDSLRFAARIAGGHTLAELAEADGVSERAERYRRATVVHRLQHIVLDNAGAP